MLAGGPAATQLLRELWGSDAGRTAFRYLGAPPISEDDLETLAEARLSPSSSDEASDKLLAIMRVIVDPRRFPWLLEERPPSAAEVHAAAVASASLIASQRVQTLRRSDEKAAVEGAVKGLLVAWDGGSRRCGPRAASRSC